MGMTVLRMSKGGDDCAERHPHVTRLCNPNENASWVEKFFPASLAVQLNDTPWPFHGQVMQPSAALAHPA